MTEQQSDQQTQTRPVPASGSTTARHPAARFRRVPDPARARPRRPCAARSRSATGTSTPRRCTATRRSVGQAIRAAGLARDEVFVTSKLNNGFHRARRRALRVRRDAGRARPRRRRPVPDPLAAATRRRRLRQTWTRWRRSPRTAGPARSGSRTSRPPTCAGWPPDRGGAGGQPDRGAPLLRQRRGARVRPEHGIATEAWSPIAQGAGARRPGDHHDRQAAGPDAGAGHAALAHPARRHRLPEVGHAGRIEENFELFDFELDDDATQALSHLNKKAGRPDQPEPDALDFVPEARPPGPVPDETDEASGATLDPAAGGRPVITTSIRTRHAVGARRVARVWRSP